MNFLFQDLAHNIKSGLDPEIGHSKALNLFFDQPLFGITVLLHELQARQLQVLIFSYRFLLYQISVKPEFMLPSNMVNAPGPEAVKLFQGMTLINSWYEVLIVQCLVSTRQNNFEVAQKFPFDSFVHRIFIWKSR